MKKAISSRITRIRSERGQIMALGALAVLLVVLMMLLTLNVGQAIYEKIRIQQVADSAAFSTANQEARAFNFFAYTNRANIANLVAAVSATSYMDMATMVPELFMAVAINYFIMSGEEMSKCCSGCPPVFPCCKIHHCLHSVFDMVNGIVTFIRVFPLASAVQKVDKKYSELIAEIDDHMKKIYEAQEDMREFIGMQLSSDMVGMGIVNQFAPRASNSNFMVSGKNRDFYNDVFEGDADKARFVPTEIANGTRDARDIMFPGLRMKNQFEKFINDDTFDDFTDGPVFDGESEISVYLGASRVIEGAGFPLIDVISPQAGPEGDAVGAFEIALIKTEAYCCDSMMPAIAWLASGNGSGSHFALIWPLICGAEHGNFSCLGDGECFTLFKSNKDPAADFGQPKVYSFVTQDLREMKGGGRGAWELTAEGKISVDIGPIGGGRQEVRLADDPNEFGRGNAMSKALVYYHWPDYTDSGGWKEHPNFFNPFWRAKLQPFRRDEAMDVITRSACDNMGDYLGMVGAGVPLP